jgi:hypothetical protein
MKCPHTFLATAASLCALLVSVGCSNAADEGEGSTQAVSKSAETVTPNWALSRFVKLMKAEDYQRRPLSNVYDGSTPTGRKSCFVHAFYLEGTNYLKLSLGAAEDVTYKPVGEPLEFELLGQNPTAMQHPASTISKWKDDETSISFTVDYDGDDGHGTADVSVSTETKTNLSLKVTTGKSTYECVQLRLEGSSGE